MEYKEENDEEGPSYTAIAAVLRLSKLRSQYLIGKALSETFATEAEWQDALNDPETMEQFEAAGFIADDLRSHLGTVDPTPEAVEDAAALEYKDALETIQLFADDIGATIQDLLHVLVTD